MKRIEDKFGNALLIEKADDGFISVELKLGDDDPLMLGRIHPQEKAFYVETSYEHFLVSDKFMVEAKTFDKVILGDNTITLNSLLYLLCLPHGMQVDSFAEFSYIKSDFKFIQFKSKYEAMLYMCDVYEKYFNENPPYPAKIGNITVEDGDRFVEISLAFIRNLATLKKGGDPYFLQLTKYYNYARTHPNSDH